MEKVDTRNKRMTCCRRAASVETAWSVSMLTGVTGTGIGVYCRCQKGWTHGYNRPEGRNRLHLV